MAQPGSLVVFGGESALKFQQSKSFGASTERNLVLGWEGSKWEVFV